MSNTETRIVAEHD